MMRCRGDKTRGFHKMTMMKFYHADKKGNYFVCPICGRKAISGYARKHVTIED